jgi:flagellar biosynthesis GTPase FlhF
MVAVHNNINDSETGFSADSLQLPIKVRARTSIQALAEVTERLGEDAIVIATRTINDPITNKRMVEIEATVEGETQNDNQPAKIECAPQRKAPVPMRSSSLFKVPGVTPSHQIAPPPPAANTDAMLAILQEVRGMRSELRAQKEHHTTAISEVYALRRELREVEIAVSNLTSEHAIIREHGIPGEWVPSYRRLIAASIDSSLAEEIIRDTIETKVSDECDAEEKDDNDRLIEAIANKIKIKPILNEALPSPVVTLTGPAGAGKTTMVAKIAAHAVLKGRSTVGIIACEAASSFDTLSKVAGALGTPIICASKDKGGLSRAVYSMQQEGVDLILIDTPAIRMADRESNKVLWRELKSVIGSEIIAVLPATMRDIDMSRACKILSRLGFHRLAFTQMDESLRTGSVLTAMSATGLPLAALSYGTSYTDDLVLPDPKEIALRMVRPPRTQIETGKVDA